jgi:stage II sporulation protein R
MKRVFCIISLFILFFSFVFISAKSYANNVLDDLSDNFFRLHILANSDSDEDQNLKLKVRDNIIKYMNQLSYDGLTKQDAINLTCSNLNNFKQIAEKTIIDEGYDYSVNLEIGNFYFPTKEYGNISLPAGYYDALKIEIGNANGKNWWCSLFPPLCFVDISAGVIDEESEEFLKENLSDEEFAIITDSSENVKFKFKIIEMLNDK